MKAKCFGNKDIIWLHILCFSDILKYNFVLKWLYCIENSFKKHEGNSNEKQFITGRININIKNYSMWNIN